MPKHTHKAPPKASTARTLGRASVRFFMRAVAGVFLVIMGLFFYKNWQAPHPLMVAITPKADTPKTDTPHTPSQATLIIDSDDAHLPYLYAISAHFHRHHPDIRLHIRPMQAGSDATPADFFFGTVDAMPDSFVNFATQESKVLKAHFNKNSPTALTFRDFLLSSPAQDLLHAHGMTSIEPYRPMTDPFKPTS